MGTIIKAHKKEIKFTVKGNMIIKPVIKPIIPGVFKWPIIEKNGKQYLSKSFTFVVPKGIEYLKIIVPQYNGEPLAKFRMLNAINGKTWLYCTDNASLTSVIHVSHYTSTTDDTRVPYSLVLNDAHIETDPIKGRIELRYSKEINMQYMNDNVTHIVEDIVIKN